MEWAKILGITVSCIVLSANCVNLQFPYGYNPNDPGQITFVYDQPADSKPPWAIQKAPNSESFTVQSQELNQQPFGIQQQSLGVRPQPYGIPQQPLITQRQAAIQRPTTNQLNVQPLRNQDAVQSKSATTMKAKEIIRLDDTAIALTNFSINLMKKITQQTPGNTVVSPYSIATLLALLQQGATGATMKQLFMALQMDQQTSAAAYKAQTEDIQKRSSRNILRTANNIYLADGFKLNATFRATALRDFHSDVTPTNFALGAETAEEINRWVARNTDNKITNLIAPDALSINTQMVLVNAMYFKGLWEMPFRKQATKPGEFRLKNRAVVMAQFMQKRHYFRTGVDSYTASKVIVLPFEREEYSLMVILPHTLSNVADTLSTLTVSQLEDYLNFPHLETQLELPKFSIKADTDLTTVLKQMGISKLFTDSELLNIGTFQNTISPQVSEAVHSAALTIDEEGGSATAATAFAVVALSNDDPSVVFRANRPFLAVLWDGKSRLPLFVAKIEDPTL